LIKANKINGPQNPKQPVKMKKQVTTQATAETMSKKSMMTTGQHPNQIMNALTIVLQQQQKNPSPDIQ